LTKYIQVKFSDGKRYNILASIIAHERATYYANHDEGEQGVEPTSEWKEVYRTEFDLTLEDNSELLDWASNNMNWSDVEGRAILIPSEPKKVDYEDEWTNAKRKVVNL